MGPYSIYSFVSLKPMLLHISEVYLNIDRYLGCSHSDCYELSCCDIFVCLLVCIRGLKLHFYLVCIGEKKWLICLYRLAHAAKYFSKMVVPVYTFTSSILLHMKKVL